MKLLIHFQNPTVQSLTLGMDKYFHIALYRPCDYLSLTKTNMYTARARCESQLSVGSSRLNVYWVFSLILESAVSLSSGIQSAGDLVSETMGSNPVFSRGRNLSPFDSNIACLCQSIDINNNKHVYRQSQERKPTASGVEWAACSLMIIVLGFSSSSF